MKFNQPSPPRLCTNNLTIIQSPRSTYNLATIQSPRSTNHLATKPSPRSTSNHSRLVQTSIDQSICGPLYIPDDLVESHSPVHHRVGRLKAGVRSNIRLDLMVAQE